MYEPIGNDLLVGIEAKLTDWNRALRQAALNRYAVDASMIALPIDRISEAMLSAADEYGVGVLGIHGRGLTVALPATVSCPDAALHARVITQLKPVKARGRVRVNEIVKGIERP
jgi:hypothetical protein